MSEVIRDPNLARLIPQDTPEHLLKAPPPAVYPKMELPESPVIDRPNPGGIPHPDCEGFTEIDYDKADNSMIPDPAPGKARILLGIPMLDIKYEFFESFIKLWTLMCVRQNPTYEIAYTIMYRKPVHMAEESLVKTAKFNKATHLLLMDDDIYDVMPQDIDKLLEANKDVIGGVMHASKFPHAMCVFRRFNLERKVTDMPVDTSMFRLYEVPCICKSCGAGQSHWDGKFCIQCGLATDNIVQQADLIPFALTLIKMSVFDKIKKPWFHCTNDYPTDSWFADRLLEVGLTEHAHMGVRLNHAGITDETKPYYAQMGMARAQKNKAVVQITPEAMDLHQNLLVNKMKETEASLKPKPMFIADGRHVGGQVPERDLTLITHGT